MARRLFKMFLSRPVSVAGKWQPFGAKSMSKYIVDVPKGGAVSSDDEIGKVSRDVFPKGAELMNKYGVDVSNDENRKATENVFPKVATSNSCEMRAVAKSLYPRQIVLYQAGGQIQGLPLPSDLPEAMVQEARILTSEMSLIDTIGEIPVQFCSEDTAADLAMVAYDRACSIAYNDLPFVAVGLISPWANTQPNLGDCRIYFAIMTDPEVWVYSFSLTKGLRTSEEEVDLLTCVLLKEIAIACGVTATFDSGLTESEVLVKRRLPIVDSYSRRRYLRRISRLWKVD